MKLTVVNGFRSVELAAWARQHLCEGSRWFSNGLHVSEGGGWNNAFSLDVCRDDGKGELVEFMRAADDPSTPTPTVDPWFVEDRAETSEGNAQHVNL